MPRSISKRSDTVQKANNAYQTESCTISKTFSHTKKEDGRNVFKVDCTINKGNTSKSFCKEFDDESSARTAYDSIAHDSNEEYLSSLFADKNGQSELEQKEWQKLPAVNLPLTPMMQPLADIDSRNKLITIADILDKSGHEELASFIDVLLVQK
jgi:hypothetical protein